MNYKEYLDKVDEYLEHMTPKQARKLDSNTEYKANKELSKFD